MECVYRTFHRIDETLNRTNYDETRFLLTFSANKYNCKRTILFHKSCFSLKEFYLLLLSTRPLF